MHMRRLISIVLTTCLTLTTITSLLIMLVSASGVDARGGSKGKGHPVHRTHGPILVSTPYKLRTNATRLYTEGYSPAQITGAYGLSGASTGAGITIAIVDAFHDPRATADFDTFAKRFGLPTIEVCHCFTQVNQTGGKKYPHTDSSWALEISLDIEWAHAIAPRAHILLVEAKDNNLNNMFVAEDYATAHAQVISNSWGGSEFSGETSYDSHFNKPIAITFSAGDNGSGANYPASSPYVLTVGGTTLNIDGTMPDGSCIHNSCAYGSEAVWSGSGGGASKFESMPAYQAGYCGTMVNVNNCSSKRGTPDIAWVADPGTGVAVYDSTPLHHQKGWFVVGGTSVGAPGVAGLIALADQANNTTLTTNDLSARFDYQGDASATNYSADYHDLTSGQNGSPCCQAAPGYDLASGLGTPIGDSWISNT